MKIEYLPPTSLVPEQRVEIEVTGGDWKGIYLSSVRSVAGRDITLDAPLSGGVWVPLRPETPVVVRVSSARGLLSFDSQVVERQPGARPTVSVARPGRLMAVQRRGLFRIDARLPVTFDRAEGDLLPAARMESGVVVNLSGGGAALRTSLPLRAGEWLRVRFPVDDKERDPLVVAAEVLDVGSRRARFDTERIARLRFSGLSSRDEGRLFRLIRAIERGRLRERRALRDL